MGFIAQAAISAAPILDLGLIKRVRRNHALEHATVHVLAERVKELSAGGMASLSGFRLITNATAEEVEAAAHEALRRLRAGEAKLAVHPNCGTSYLTKAAMSGGAAMLGSMGMNNKRPNYLERLPLVTILAFVGLIAAEPIGLQLQEHFTTCGDPGDLQITSVSSTERATQPTTSNGSASARTYRNYFIHTSGG